MAPMEAKPAAVGPQFPASWRDLVEAWKQKKPLQARKLEEVHPLSYSADNITIAIPEDSFASKTLLQADEQARIRDQFRELFGFKGQLRMIPRGEALKSAPAAMATIMEAPPVARPVAPTPAAKPAAAARSTPKSAPAAKAPVTTKMEANPAAAYDDEIPLPGDLHETLASASRPPQDEASESPILRPAAAEALLPETLLTVRTREDQQRRDKLIESARNAPFTKEVLAVFGATIEDVRIREGSGTK